MPPSPLGAHSYGCQNGGSSWPQGEPSGVEVQGSNRFVDSIVEG
jgi:hypothetical protein